MGQPVERLLGLDAGTLGLSTCLEGEWPRTFEAAFPGGAGISDDDRLEFVIQSAQKWLWRTEVVERAFAAHQGPKLMMRYEDLRRDTATQLRKLFAWLDVEISGEALDAMIGNHAFERLPEEQRGAQSFHRAASPGLWRENLSEREQDALERMIGPKLLQLGYTA